jgi:holliday junction DNA helicase RuvA
MIALLTGTVAQKNPDTVIVDVNGVGYRVQIPFSTYFELPDKGAPCSLHIHTHVKEDAIHLFGFRSFQEKQCFQLLLSVSGVGPKLARDILSNIQPPDLVAALAQGNLGRLSAIPGIGKKTAERLVLELKDKIRKLDIDQPATTVAVVPGAAELLDDVASALVNLGYKEAQVRKVLDEIGAIGETPMETVLKQALKQLMK